MNKKPLTVLFCLLILTGCAETMPKLGLEKGQLMPCPSSPNCVCSQVEGGEHFIEPIQVNATPSQAKAQLLSVLEARPRTRITAQKANYIRAESVSRVFRFVDDIEFLIMEREPDNTVIHVRSASRVGYSDLGVNRKRVEQIRRQLSERSE